MSFFTTAITQLTTADLQSLLGANAVENVRLEFKLEIPSKDETLKKLSSFANTFGGFLVIGAQASSTDGRLKTNSDISSIAAR
jgi:predicted HTH transcriptional regulator